MKTATTQTTGLLANDSSKRPTVEERTHQLVEATLNALREAGLERQRKEQAEQALRESQNPYPTDPKKTT